MCKHDKCAERKSKTLFISVSNCHYLNLARMSRDAVSLTSNPVHSDALYPADAISDHVLSPGLVSLGPADGAQAHVYPVDRVIVCGNK